MVRSAKFERPGKQNLIKAVTAQSVGRFRQSGTPIERPEVQFEPPNPGGSRSYESIPHPKGLKQGYNLRRKKLAAHLVAWEFRFLDQDYAAAFLPRGNRGGRARRTSTENAYGSQATSAATVGLSTTLGRPWQKWHRPLRYKRLQWLSTGAQASRCLDWVVTGGIDERTKLPRQSRCRGGPIRKYPKGR